MAGMAKTPRPARLIKMVGGTKPIKARMTGMVPSPGRNPVPTMDSWTGTCQQQLHLTMASTKAAKDFFFFFFLTEAVNLTT